jgi:hypothetical protein
MERTVAKPFKDTLDRKELYQTNNLDSEKGIPQQRITDGITHGYNVNKHTGLVLLDTEKAYDTIWVSGLIYKLINFDISFKTFVAT